MAPVVVVQSLALVVMVHSAEVTADMLLLLGWCAVGLHVVFGLGADGIGLQAAVACQEMFLLAVLLHVPGKIVALVQKNHGH